MVTEGRISGEKGGEGRGLLSPNPGKQLAIEAGGRRWLRLPISTELLTAEDDLLRVAEERARPHLKPGDILFLSEKAVACTQGRAVPVEEIHPRPLAVLLSRFVTRTPYGIGLGLPETMELALQECGTPRILTAAAAGAVGRLLGRRGWFYVVAGRRAAAIDGPTPNTIPPYHRCVVPAPRDPDLVACRISEQLGVPVLVVDVNDLGGTVLGMSHRGLDRKLMVQALRDNPLGQCRERTPMGILRPQP